MNRNTFNQDVIAETFDSIQQLSNRKGRDYSGDDDVLTSFKSNAAYLGTDPKMIWAVLVLKHWDALMTFIRTGRLESEGIEQRLDDLIVYILLFKAMLAEESAAETAVEGESA